MEEIKKQEQEPASNLLTPEQDYTTNFVPAVHRIGRFTMVIAFFLAFLPVIYFLIRGYTLPISSYVNVIVAVASIGIGMWVTEPLAYWPVLGSAGTYIGYLSGNVGAMRFPVALSIQSAMDADINTPRGQVATIVGIVASVFSNLVILIVIVLAGSWLITVLPEAVIAAFGFVMPTLMGAMIQMRFNGKSGLVQGFLVNFPYLATAVICKLIITHGLTFLANYGMAVTVAMCLIVAYIIYRRDCAKDAANGQA